MKKFILIIFGTSFILINIILSCQMNSDCNKIRDIKFAEKFNSYIKIIKDSYYGDPDSALTTDSLFSTITYLVFVTGLESNAYIGGDIVGYYYKYQVDSDLKNWEEWFRKNKCKVDLKTADSIFFVKRCALIKNDSIRNALGCP